MDMYGAKDNKEEPFEERMNRRPRERQQWGSRQRENRGYGDRQRGEYAPRRNIDPIKENLASIRGPTTNLETKEGAEPRKFTGRCRLFVGNLPSTISEESFRDLFKPYGETGELFLNASKGFAFVKMDTRRNAEAAKMALDCSVNGGKTLRVRYATHNNAIKVKGLSPWVSNELLEKAFSVFGEVERAVVIVDDRGKPVGDGIVEYAKKPAALAALRKCEEGCFLLTEEAKPVIVEPLELRDEEDGLQEKHFQKNSPEFLKEREIGPRLAEPGTFEYEFSSRWMQLYETERQKRERLEQEILEGRHQLSQQAEFVRHEYETKMLREKLRQMEEQSSMYQRQMGMRREMDYQWGEQYNQEEPMLSQRQQRGGAEEPRMMHTNGLAGMRDRPEAALGEMHGRGLQNVRGDFPRSGMDQDMMRGPHANVGMRINQPYMDAPIDHEEMEAKGSPRKRANPSESGDKRD